MPRLNIPISMSALARRTVFAVVLASAANAALAALGKALSHPPDSFGPYQYDSVVGLTALGVVLAACSYALMRIRFPDASRANRYFIWLSLAALVVSFYPDVALPWSSDPDQIGWTYGIMANLMLMHVVAAAIVVPILMRVPSAAARTA